MGDSMGKVGSNLPGEFRAQIKKMTSNVGYQKAADDYGVSLGVIYKVANPEKYPNYCPTLETRRKLGLVPDHPPRIAIRKDDPESAARSIINNCERRHVETLAALLIEHLEE